MPVLRRRDRQNPGPPEHPSYLSIPRPMKTFLHRARFVFPLMLALMLVAPLTDARAGGRRSSKEREPFKPVYKAITSVDATAHTVSYSTVNGVGAANSKTFKITDKTEIEVNGLKSTLNDLKAGMQVDISPAMDETVADRISAKTAPPEPSSSHARR